MIRNKEDIWKDEIIGYSMIIAPIIFYLGMILYNVIHPSSNQDPITLLGVIICISLSVMAGRCIPCGFFELMTANRTKLLYSTKIEVLESVN